MTIKGCDRTEFRLGLVRNIQAQLQRLARDVCPLCEVGDPTHCEIVDGERTHIRARCAASAVLRLAEHVDDIRHQYANEWNPDEDPRAKWGFVVVNEPSPDPADPDGPIGLLSMWNDGETT